MAENKRHIILGSAWFAASVLLTWLFIEAYDTYVSPKQMLLSGGVAGGKWAIQLLLATLLLGDKRWLYFKEMGFISAIGSTMLMLFLLGSRDTGSFISSLVFSVMVMATMVILRLRAIKVPTRWIVLWFGLLAIAVSLQIFVVFKIDLSL